MFNILTCPIKRHFYLIDIADIGGITGGGIDHHGIRWHRIDRHGIVEHDLTRINWGMNWLFHSREMVGVPVLIPNATVSTDDPDIVRPRRTPWVRLNIPTAAVAGDEVEESIVVVRRLSVPIDYHSTSSTITTSPAVCLCFTVLPPTKRTHWLPLLSLLL